MIWFVGSLTGLITITVIYQLISKMKLIGGNELGIISGKKAVKGFTTITGGRAFIIPLFNKFAKFDLTPQTIEVVVDSAIANGVVPLNVKATVSFAISSSEHGRHKAVTRILHKAHCWNELCDMASSIIEGHLRDAIAPMTPEEVMKDKNQLISNMINVCKSDLENIGLEITTMNIADVDDHRLPDVNEPDLYIALLKRVQTENASTQAREAQAKALASSKEKEQERRAETDVRKFNNEYESLVASTRVHVAEENQRRTVGVEQKMRNAAAEVAGLKSQIAAEKERIEMLKQKYEADIITPALAEKERQILEARAKRNHLLGKAQAEIDQLKQTLKIIQEGGDTGQFTYIIENFSQLISPFAETMKLFPVDKLSIISGMEGKHTPISAIHPHAVDAEKNDLLQKILAETLGTSKDVKESLNANTKAEA